MVKNPAMTLKLRNFLEIPFLSALIFFSSFNAKAINLDLARFVGAKEAQVRAVAATQTNKVPAYLWRFFDAVRVDDWDTATNLAARLHRASGYYAGAMDTNQVLPILRTLAWPSISETLGAYEQFHDWDNQLVQVFGTNIIQSIPPGSIYFGGTDPGRFVISVMSESLSDGKPFFILTQNQLVSSAYLDYVRSLFGKKIYIPTTEDAQSAFEAYRKDAQARMKAGKLKPGESVRTGEDGQIQVEGVVSVMEINGLLAKMILEKNPARKCYIEESFPLDWMYSNLTPHGLIMELHHEPVTALSPTLLQSEQDYWSHLVGGFIGDWLTDKTSITAIDDFAEKVYLGKNLDDFKGNPAFVKNDAAQKSFSKLRSSLAGMYAWRSEHATDPAEKSSLRQAADLAFRQAFALCPYSPEAVYRYVNFLIQYNRPDDALRIAKTAMHLRPDDRQFQGVVQELTNYGK